MSIRHVLDERKGAAPCTNELLQSLAGLRLLFVDHWFLIPGLPVAFCWRGILCLVEAKPSELRGRELLRNVRAVSSMLCAPCSRFRTGKCV
eukprot:1595594-Amphidinium_carterae.3